jgi:imidazolonepropionase
MPDGAPGEVDLILDRIAQLVLPTRAPQSAGAPQAARFRVETHQALAVRDGLIVAQGPRDRILAAYRAPRIHDAGGRLVTPGLVDAHTHLLYYGQRAHEVALKARGATYLEILAAGGGILATVAATRAASDADLLRATRARLGVAVAHGTTTLEMKTGYALTVAGELHHLDLLQELDREGPWRLVKTFLGAHAVPEAYRGRPAAYLAELRQAHSSLPGRADFVDIFLEPGVFDAEDAVAYLTDARAHGLALKLHVDELQDGGGAEVGARLGAVSVDHLAHTGPEGVRALAASGTVAVLLPGTSAYLNQGAFAPARMLLEHGVPVAVASDGNPGSSPTAALGSLLPWAAAWLRMTPEELWPAVTTVAGQAVRRPWAGSLDPGAPADFAVWNTDDYRVPCYEYGANLVKETWIGGRQATPDGLSA